MQQSQNVYHNTDYNFTFIKDESEVEKAKSIIVNLKNKMKSTVLNEFQDEEDVMKYWKYNNIIKKYIDEIEWIQLKIKEYYQRQIVLAGDDDKHV
jgi:hypothetical protein